MRMYQEIWNWRQWTHTGKHSHIYLEGRFTESYAENRDESQMMGTGSAVDPQNGRLWIAGRITAVHNLLPGAVSYNLFEIESKEEETDKGEEDATTPA